MKGAGLKPGAPQYGAFLTACGRRGDPVKARQLIDEMDSELVHVDTGHLTSCITACARAGEETYARQFMAEFVRRGLRPDVIVYTNLINSFKGADSLAKADEAFIEMKQTGITP